MPMRKQRNHKGKRICPTERKPTKQSRKKPEKSNLDYADDVYFAGLKDKTG